MDLFALIFVVFCLGYTCNTSLAVHVLCGAFLSLGLCCDSAAGQDTNLVDVFSIAGTSLGVVYWELLKIAPLAFFPFSQRNNIWRKKFPVFFLLSFITSLSFRLNAVVKNFTDSE